VYIFLAMHALFNFGENVMIINIITCVVCLAMLILFRKLDRTNIKMAKLRRYSSRLFDEFKKLAETENRRFNDATIEMDILIKKSNALAKNINTSVSEIEAKLQGLDIEKTNLKKVEEDIRVISQSAREVNKQIEFIAGAKESFVEISQSLSYSKETIKNLKGESAEILQNFNNRLKEKSRELSAEFSEQISKLRDAIESKEDLLVNSSRQKLVDLTETLEHTLADMDQRVTDTGEILLQNFKVKIDGVAKSVEGASNLQTQIEMLKLNLSDLEGKVFSDIKERSSGVQSEIQQSIDVLYAKLQEFESEFDDSKDILLGRFQTDIDKLNNKLSAVESNVNESKSKLIKTFEIEADKVRTELDNLNIHAISKRDEIIQATRREAEEVRKEIENFESRFLEFETRIIDTAETKVGELGACTGDIELKLADFQDKLGDNETQLGNYVSVQMQRIKDDFSLMEHRLSDMKSEILSYEDQTKVFSKTESLIRDVNDQIERLNRMLQESQKEAQHLDKFFSDIDYLKELTKEFDREIRSYQNKKEKLADIESEIRTLEELSDQALQKAGSFQEQYARIDAVSSRIDALMESYGSLEARIRELHEYEDVIARNLDSVNKADILIQSVEGRIGSFQKVVDRSEKRVDKINQHMRGIEESLLILKTRENDIKEIKDKFNELDGLSEIMEARVKQLQAMFKKVETLRDEISSTDNHLQELFTQTDKRMRQFADFIQAVDNNNPILKQVKGTAGTHKNINDNVIRTVRELSDKGLSSDEISRKMMMDENAVRLIINTTSL
jgi:chromosome segregation ATPase